MTDETPPPSAVPAEQAVLGVCLRSAEALTHARAMLGAADWYRPAHETIFAAMLDLAERGQAPDPLVVMDELTRTGQLARAGGATYLHTLMATPATIANVGWHAQQIRAASRRRQMVSVAARLTQAAHDMTDPDDLTEFAARESLALELIVENVDTDRPIDGLSTVDSFLAEHAGPADWIVPALIESQDVFMLLSEPGAGKSFLSRQMAFAVAAGVHPFKPTQRIAPQRTLLVDFENPKGMVRRQIDPLVSHLKRIGDWDPERQHVWMRPEGMDLRKHADAQEFERTIATVRPRLVALGSLYKAYQRGRDDWDTAAEETRAVFDRMRARYGCAFWLEHHMPKSSGGGHAPNPFGSSVWERWPGFGRVIREVGPNVWELLRFRGDRDEREIPAGMYRGGSLPWSPIFDEEELEIRRGK